MTAPRLPLPAGRPLMVGAARSGIAAARLLARLGLAARVCDQRPEHEMREAAAELARVGAEGVWGSTDPATLAGIGFLVWSPGIPIDHPLARAARERGLPVLSELELGFRVARAEFVGITGTNGKSTTTDLVGALLRSGGREVRVCGNIGRPVCDVADQLGEDGVLVAEVSSFQLESVDLLRPWVATWLNLTPDHLDRHGDLDAYGALKQRLFARQGPGDWAVWNADDPEVSRRRTGGGTPLEFSAAAPVAAGAYLAGHDLTLAWHGRKEALMPAAAMRLRGPHNRMNALAALATVLPFEVAPEALRSTLAQYAGLEHRLEPAGAVEGVAFVNDSKATNVGSLEVALRSFEQPVVLIAGGRDKGQDFTPLAPLARARVRMAVLIGEGAERIAAAWPEVPHRRADSLAGAVRAAFAAARPDGTVLLSPGCASFDMFRDYEDRGRRFKEEVESLRTRAGAAT